MQTYPTTEVSLFDPQDDSVAAHEMWVDHGELVEGTKRTHVGTRASDLQKLIDALPPAKPLANVTALINSTQLRRLRLTGRYTGDQTLHLPSLFVLELDEGTTYSGSAAGLPGDGLNSLVMANGTYYTAIVGGHWDCTQIPMRYYATTGLLGTFVRAFTVTCVTVRDCGEGLNYSSGNVMVQNGDHGEVSHSEMMGRNARGGNARGLWLERNTGLSVHHNHIHDCVDGPLIDVDNGNSGVLVYSNVLENTEAYGLWLELNTVDCYAFNSGSSALVFPLHNICVQQVC
eukprot:SAG31_NODE_1357_length_8647_cov_8.257838_5_plen_287_part_00